MAEQNGLKIARKFTSKDENPFDLFQYTTRQSTIRNVNGEKSFEMDAVEVPEHWSQLATDILAQKYFRRTGVPDHEGNTGREYSVKQVVHRMAACWRKWGEQYGYFATHDDGRAFYDEVVYSLLAQYAAPNSPQWFNTGLYESYGISGKSQGHWYTDPDTGVQHPSDSAYERPQVHACFILSVNDDLVNDDGIMDLWKKEARLFKYGSGAGTNYSSVRGKNEPLSGGGYSSGLMSFLRVGDRAAGAIKSGGTTRRAARMVCLDLDHPEIVDFIKWKPEEEKKVAVLQAAGYDAGFEGEAYATVSGQNSNNSVRIPDYFFKYLEENASWQLCARVDADTQEQVKAQSLWQQIAEAAWSCGDPGLQFDTTINQWHTCPEDGRIRASNPCSEYMFLDNTACNLASLNLVRFWDRDRNEFDIESFQHYARIWTIVLEISVLMAQYPTREIAKLSYEYRTLGLGFTNLGSMLMRAGLPYGSETSRAIAGAVTALLTGTAYRTSAEMAAALGTFPAYENNKSDMLRVIRNHRAAAYNAPDAFEGEGVSPRGINEKYCPDYLLQTVCRLWDEVLQTGEHTGFRNAQVSAIAPAGTISFIMDCDTTGVEPDFALVKFKKLSGGGVMKIVNHAVPEALKALGYEDAQIRDIIAYIRGTGTFRDNPYINFDTLKAKGFHEKEIERLDEAVQCAYDISNIFTDALLDHDFFERTGIDKEKIDHHTTDLLHELGFSTTLIQKANEHICGRMTIEGAPHLHEKHLPVFDCANRCGQKGTRFLDAADQIKMIGAVQSFVSGAISKTINVTHEKSSEDIAGYFKMAWEEGLKACTIYRDGSKVIQPLSTNSGKNKNKRLQKSFEEELSNHFNNEMHPDHVLEAVKKLVFETEDTTYKRQLAGILERKRLPVKRNGFTQKAKINGQTIFVRTGEYPDGTLGEVFIDMYKEGVTFRSMLNCFAIAISIGLQYGVPLEEYVSKFVFSRFEPSGMVEHPYIKSATSVLDYVFRLLAREYLGREDLIHVIPQHDVKTERYGNHAQNEGKDILETAKNPENQPEATSVSNNDAETHNVINDYLYDIDGDAPPCDVCGHMTVRSGTCFKCLNCGNSLGCS